MNSPAPDDAVYGGGFSDPVLSAQIVFRAVLAAMAEPALPVACAPLARGPSPMSPLMASLAQTLLDQDTPVWLDPALAGEAAVARWLAFHTGAPVTTDPASAAFALVSDMVHLPPLASFAPGTADYPDRSTTVIVAVEGFTVEGPSFDGPGFDQPRRFAPLRMPDGLVGEIAANRALFPRGVDLVFVADGSLAGLPRSTRIAQE